MKVSQTLYPFSRVKIQNSEVNYLTNGAKRENGVGAKRGEPRRSWKENNGPRPLLQKVGMYVPYSCHAPGVKEGQAGLKIQADDKVQLSFLVREKCRSEKLRDNVNIDIASWWQKGLALWSPDLLFISLLMTHFSFGV